MENFWLAFGLTLLAGLSTGIGGLISVVPRRSSGPFLSVSLGFSAGVMLYVSFMEIMPKALTSLTDAAGATAGPWAAGAAFFVGILVIGVIDRLVPAQINPHEPGLVHHPAAAVKRRRMMRTGTVTALAIGIHNFPEGFATFIAGLTDLQVALPVALAIALHNIPEGVAVAVPIREATGSRRKAVRWSFLSGLAEPAGALIGFALLMPLMNDFTLGTTFALVAGIMVFISLDELLPTAREYGKHHLAMYGLVAGMAVMAVSLLLFTTL
ncbi:zinc transporter ZupT [Citricoccus nitrophenolicus]|uniref:Zinc transporter ZupT n=1 Tax=Citricoccus nitrophenolicus TaxID=863575 RepID=A0ABV0IIJ1_9MICC|nr:zinc transporter ZupT [Citricoccus sp. I39-566]WMY77813.1 zinc transporter ZupT [Citricoccus sp. I39-566]